MVVYTILLLYSQQESAVSVHWPHTCLSIALLAPGKEEFCPRRRLQTLLCIDNMIVTLSNNHIHSLGTFVL